MDELDKFLDNFEGKTLIIIILNIRYRPIFEIWYSYFKQYQLKNYLAIALDEKMHAALNNLGVENILIPIAQIDTFLSKKKYDIQECRKLIELLWLKTQILKRVIDKGINFLFSDVDAFWVKNIYSLLESYQYDINMSISYYTPPDVAKRWGFILNTGVYLMRSNIRTRVFVEEFMKFSAENRLSSEQMNLNRFLLQNGTEWKKDSNVENEGYVPGFKIGIKAISNNIISREPKQGTYIYHPFLEGGIVEKLSFAKEGLALLETKNVSAEC